MSQTWQLTRDNLNEIDDAIDRDGIYAKGYWEYVGGRTTVTGLRIGTGEGRLVARFGDSITRHRKGRWSVQAAGAAS
ncbi:hypothetical protein [Streptomyces sp. NPDC001205]